MNTKEKKYLDEIAHYYSVVLSAETPKQEDLNAEFANIWYSLHLQKLINSICGLELLCRNKYISNDTIMELIKLNDNSFDYVPSHTYTRAEAIPKVKKINEYLFRKIEPILSVIYQKQL